MKPSGGCRRGCGRSWPASAHRVDQVLAAHLVVDAERRPAHAPSRPSTAACTWPPVTGTCVTLSRSRDRCRRWCPASASRSTIGTCSTWPVVGEIGRKASRWRGARAQRRQHDVHHLVVVLEHLEQRRVEAARSVALGGRQELVVEAEARRGRRRSRALLCVAEARMLAERVGHLASAACRDARPASPCWARCRAPCASRPCRRRSRSAASGSCPR